MGKKTDTFCANLQTYSDQTNVNTAKLLTACQQIAKYNDEWRQKEIAHNARTTEIIKLCKNDANVYEPMINKDQKLLQIGAELDKAGTILMTARKDRTTATATLNSLLFKLKTETKTFTDYIAAKEKSKNPFKTKNSLDTAKLAIKAANDLILKIGNLGLG